jgi:glycosyltransferase involved in cell wall biosynthesis
VTRWSILHFNTERDWRGGEAQTLLLAAGLARRGHACEIAAPGASPLAERARRAGIPVLPLDPRGEFDPRAALRLARRIAQTRPRVIHYHTSHAVTLGTLASYRAGRIRAVASRRVSFPLRRNPIARFKYTHRVDRILAVSEGIRATLLRAGIPPGRIAVIPSAVDLSRFASTPDPERARRGLGLPGDAFVVGSIGHLAPHKGHAVLVEAARRALAGNPRLRFLLVGRGEEEAALREAVARAGIAGAFQLAGFREEVADILPALDLLAFPSLAGEGSPAAPKEAMACGVPVVASRIQGVDEVIRDGVDGILVTPGDPDALAEAILRLAGDPGRRGEMGRKARARSREFGVEEMVDRTEEIYRRVLAAEDPEGRSSR